MYTKTFLAPLALKLHVSRMLLHELIRTRREALNLSQAQVAKHVGVSRAAVGLWESGETGPKRSNIEKLAEILQLKTEALNPLFSDGLKAVDALSSGVRLPLLQLKDFSSGGINMQGVATATEFVIADAEQREDHFALKISDNSMQPTYAPGDVIIVGAHIDPIDGDDVVCQAKSGPAILRQYKDRGLDKHDRRVFDLLSTDANYATITSNSDNLFKVIGVVVEHRRKRRT